MRMIANIGRVGSSLVARQVHILKVEGSNPSPATIKQVYVALTYTTA